MKKNWVLSQEAFDVLLDWLDHDRDQAGRRYEEIRERLVRIFASRGCSGATDLADETINRVASKVVEVRETYAGDPALFFYVVANNIHKEYLRRKPPPASPISTSPPNLEKQFYCLEQCLDQLSHENRSLVIQYYQDDKKAKIERRRQIAERLGIAPNALRIRACRIRASLLECVEKCLEFDAD